MPLIIVTGLPCSGKTYRTQQLAAELAARISSDTSTSPSTTRKVQVINSHHASLDRPYDPETRPSSELRDQIYNSAAQEKTARAEEFSAIKRAVSKDTIVIADGLNYIKGYRYQIWCEAKAAGTRCCVIHVAAQEDECKEWNRERLRAWGRQDEEEQPKKQTTGREGKDVQGDLMPESHTAIYGDRIVEKVSRSRSSSVDGQIEADNEAVNPGRQDDTLTLKSLYIRDGAETNPTRPDLPSNGHHEQPTATASLLAQTSSSLPPPPPTSSPPYSQSTLHSLIMRYEPPSPFSRWDTPLFTIPSSDSGPPTLAIYTALFPPPPKPTSKKALSQLSRTSEQANTNTEQQASREEIVRPHAATVLPTATPANALQVLESATLDVVKALLARTREPGLSASTTSTSAVSFSVPRVAGEEEIEITLSLPSATSLSQPMLQRLRRKYTQMQRGGIAHGQGFVGGRGRRDVVEGFVRFLDAEWNGDD